MIEKLVSENIHDLIFYDFTLGSVQHKTRDRKWFKSERDWKWWNNRFAGKEISSHDGQGYLQIQLLGKQFKLHRVIWLYMTGEWPNVIDHVNGVRDDNRWCNLRNVTNQENCKNQRLRSNNKSGANGIGIYPRNNLWYARIRNMNGKLTHLGYFDSKEEAIAARKAAEIKYGYSPTHGRQ